MSDTTLSEAEIEAIVKRGARQALAELGIENGHAAGDIRDLRSLLAAIRTARNTFWQTIVRITTTGIILCLLAGLALKLNLFKGD